MNISTIAQALHGWLTERNIAPEGVTVVLRCNGVRESSRVLVAIGRDLYVNANGRSGAVDLTNLHLNGLKFIVTDPDSEAREKP